MEPARVFVVKLLQLVQAAVIRKSQLAAKMRVSSEEFGVGINCHQLTAQWQKYEDGRSLLLRARSPIRPNAKLADGGQMLLCRPSALALRNAL
eukprot:1154399-Pelagomonas_calceolata.AAC.2